MGYLKGVIISRIYQLNKIRAYIDTNNAVLLYKSMILSYFDLGDIFYNSGNLVNLKSFQSLQNKALRCIYTDHAEYSTKELHKKANLLLLHERRKLNLLTAAHSHKIPQFQLCKMSNRNLRSNNKLLLSVPFQRSHKFTKSFVVQAISLWNWLPDKLKSSTEVKLFKTWVQSELKQGKLNFPE